MSTLNISTITYLSSNTHLISSAVYDDYHNFYFQGQTDTAQHCAFTPGGALVASGAAGLTLALT